MALVRIYSPDKKLCLFFYVNTNTRRKILLPTLRTPRLHVCVKRINVNASMIRVSIARVPSTFRTASRRQLYSLRRCCQSLPTISRESMEPGAGGRRVARERCVRRSSGEQGERCSDVADTHTQPLSAERVCMFKGIFEPNCQRGGCVARKRRWV